MDSPIRAPDAQYAEQLLPALPPARMRGNAPVIPSQAMRRLERERAERAAANAVAAAAVSNRARQVYNLSDDESEGEGAAAPAAAAPLVIDDGEDEEASTERRDAPGQISLSRVVTDADVDTYQCCVGAACNGSLPVEIVSMQCQHIVCRLCFNAMRRDAKTCPLCRVSPTSHAALPNLFAMAAISRLLVRCSRRSLGCGATYLVGPAFKHDIRHHEVCPFHDETCGDCGMDVAVPQMADHKANRCLRRLVPCSSGCGEQVPFEDEFEHINSNSLRGLCKGWQACPNGCAEPHAAHPRNSAEAEAMTVANVCYVKVAQLAVHLADECPMRKVTCRFPSCADKTLYAHLVHKHNNKRKNMALHLASMADAFFAQPPPSQRCPFTSAPMTRLLDDRLQCAVSDALSVRSHGTRTLFLRNVTNQAHVSLRSATVGDTRHIQILFKSETRGRDQLPMHKKFGIVLSLLGPAGDTRDRFTTEFTLSNTDEEHNFTAFAVDLLTRALQAHETQLHFHLQVWASTA